MDYLIDELDVKILNYLLQNEKLDSKKMATLFKTTQKTIYERIKKLKQNGVLLGIYPKISTSSLGYKITALVLVKLVNNNIIKEFLKKYDSANITTSFVLAGIYDLLFIVKFKNPELLSDFVDSLRDDEDVEFADLLYVEKINRESICPEPITLD
ncbi:MAG: winged helix-turn-helix transcriptional regulator [Candidatus Diapherotrites archaeon]|nr:winged helix-turn-helix transcriptional regulator [Candidatus Diapherotrites archaeon]